MYALPPAGRLADVLWLSLRLLTLHRTASSTSDPATLLPSTTNIAGLKRKTTWDQRTEQRRKQELAKKKEREMKAEKEAEKDRKARILKERKEKEREKERLAQMAQKMSAKKLERRKRRMGLTKKVAH
ncbi:hypothetical protein K437DRAFT_264206 [Tilletiaria anomala UBC 951]|uniref:rRNA-processing protein n=1 Tax=Tilletiaria anomala (strain ATCC 24038 / CBS 436.72 / UBC 951) TaxID=1037660 RepID=A0A066VPU8_TILAU|nr:uncharacterized protein K437DRAFT_264206 [Tilletiaria anomala UBC 951]KDN40789.1 hypothetical protein K437DRAFT_264206 [Tilletiaria anomala UBC 951]